MLSGAYSLIFGPSVEDKVIDDVEEKEEKKEKIKNYVLIIDKSGSMSKRWTEVIGGIEDYFDEIKKGKNSDLNTFTLIIFNHRVEIIYNQIKLKDIEKLNLECYSPKGMTSLRDAMVIAFRNLIEDKTDYGMFFERFTEDHYQVFKNGLNKDELYFGTIFTDGEDTSSQYKSSQIRQLTKYFNEKKTLDIIYFGTDVDVDKETDNLGVIYQRNLNMSNDLKTPFREIAAQQSECSGQFNTVPKLVKQYSQREPEQKEPSVNQPDEDLDSFDDLSNVEKLPGPPPLERAFSDNIVEDTPKPKCGIRKRKKSF